MLVNSFLPIVTLSLGTYTVKLPNRTENGVKLTAKTVTLKYTGVFLKGQINKVFILKSETNEAVMMPTIEALKKLPHFDLGKNSYSEEIPADVIETLNELFSSVHNEINGVSPIGLYLSGFITDDLLYETVKKYLTAFNNAVDNTITISKADCIKYASMALAAQQGLIQRENESSVISLNDKIKQLKAAKDKNLAAKFEKVTKTVQQNEINQAKAKNAENKKAETPKKPRKPRKSVQTVTVKAETVEDKTVTPEVKENGKVPTTV